MEKLKVHLKNLKRSWSRHLVTQIATFVVLTATFTVVFTIGSLLINLKEVLSLWGKDIQMTVFLEEDLGGDQLSNVSDALKTLGDFKSMKFVNKEDARRKFIEQMPGFARDVIEDPDFSNPFPASYQLGGLAREHLAKLPDLAKEILKIAGVEDVSYGQEWVENYAGFLRGLTKAGFFILITMLLGSLFVISNSIRVGVSQRREEVEIQELVGATSSMIRAPFLIEGAAMGFISSVFAVILSYVTYWFELKVLHNEMSFLSLSEVVSFYGPLSCLGLILFGTGSGILGAWICVRRINTGWAAAREGGS